MKKISVLALAASAALVAAPACAEKVGNVGAVNHNAHGTPPGSSKRPLAVGLGVQKRERIETQGEGNAQIIFNDTSTMSIGRNSSVVIDDFVYSGGGGSQGVSMAKGVMRFVGGGVSHTSGANVRTPTASIGVRGGSAMFRVGGECGTLVVHQIGRTEVSGVGNSEILNRPGYGVCVPSGGPVSEPFKVPPETIAALLAATASQGAQKGGARRRPSNEEADLALGHDRAPDVVGSPGLDALTPFWAGNAIVQSRANVDNQPGPPPQQYEDPEYRTPTSPGD